MFHSRAILRNLKYGAASFLILTAVSLPATGQAPTGDTSHPSSADQLAARDQLNQGVDAYKNAHYDEAVSHFQKSLDLDPDLPVAKLYLATALAQNVVPGLDTPDNLKTAEKAIDLFQELLAKDPHDVNSMRQMAAIFYAVKKPDDTRVWQKRVLDEDPQDSDAAYWIGVIDWAQAHQNALNALQPAGFVDDGEGNAKAPTTVLETIKAQNSALVEEGLKYLLQAVDNRPNYADAMVYLNLTYRRKADLDWKNKSIRKEDVAKAEEWREKAMATRKANEEKKQAAPSSDQP
ncbi:MAG: tetratricopeptide repeat protein [Terracidiphilus sp.]